MKGWTAIASSQHYSRQSGNLSNHNNWEALLGSMHTLEHQRSQSVCMSAEKANSFWYWNLHDSTYDNTMTGTPNQEMRRPLVILPCHVHRWTAFLPGGRPAMSWPQRSRLPISVGRFGRRTPWHPRTQERQAKLPRNRDRLDFPHVVCVSCQDVWMT